MSSIKKKKMSSQWVKLAWDKLSPDLIKKSLLVCVVSNSLDGSELNLINVFKPGNVMESYNDDIRAMN